MSTWKIISIPRTDEYGIYFAQAGRESAVVLAAHKNPRFVEDCVREMAKKVLAEFEYLSGDSVVIIKQTNEESIHQHDAYAERRATIAELFDELNSEKQNIE
jgi:GTP cyclohydrolase-4